MLRAVMRKLRSKPRAGTIKRLLRLRGLTLTEVARHAGCSRTMVSLVVSRRSTSARISSVIDRMIAETPEMESA